MVQAGTVVIHLVCSLETFRIRLETEMLRNTSNVVALCATLPLVSIVVPGKAKATLLSSLSIAMMQKMRLTGLCSVMFTSYVRTGTTVMILMAVDFVSTGMLA